MAEETIDYTQQVQQHVEVSDQIIKGKITIDDGLTQLLDIIPLGCKDVALLEKNSEAILSVLASVKEVKETYVSNLSPEQQDWLLMYVYKGLGAPENKDATYKPAAQIMFKWFNAIYKIGGEGCVMRAVSRRRAL